MIGVIYVWARYVVDAIFIYFLVFLLVIYAKKIMSH